MLLGSVTIFVATWALILGLVQFLNRHRPYLCVASLELEQIEDGYLIRIDVSNLGEIPAKNLELKAVQLSPFKGASTPLITNRTLGICFPSQHVQTYVSPRSDATMAFLNSDIPLSIDITLNYRSPFSIGWKKIGYGIHQTYQPLWVYNKTWGVPSEGDKASFT